MKTNYIKFIIPVATLAVTSCIGGTKKPNTKTGFVKMTETSIVCSDLNPMYAPSKGDVKMLVLPIAFTGEAKDGDLDKYIDWTEQKLADVNEYYFGKTDSLATYYSAASFNELRITGMVAPVYENTTISATDILDDWSMNTLFDLIENAVSWLQDTDTTIDWSEYDLNQDACIDNIHLVTNYNSETWNDHLWPHMYHTNRTGTLERPAVNVYSLSGTGFVENSITAIHEQGHIFGLQDYYDYTSQAAGKKDGIDYIGGLDMQSNNCFDWNSFSKLCMGWVKPYVINGKAEVTTVNIKAATINGDCILIPANYDTWNGSAFDEYFLLELFAPYGNNRKDWQKNQTNLGTKPGIRLYHVDARAFGSNNQYAGRVIVDDLETQLIRSKEDIANWNYCGLGTNNSSNYLHGNGGIQQLGNYPLLSVVQKGGHFTFAKEGERHILSAGDLFKVGDEFSFDKYSIFLNKLAEEQDTMNNGEEFPYTFVVDYIDEDDATITFTKVKH